MDSFEYNAHPVRVIFGSGTLQQLADEVKRLGASRLLLLSTPGSANRLTDLHNILVAAKFNYVFRFPKAEMHTPVSISEEATEYAKSLSADCIISIGGGSTIGLGKAIKLRTGLPHVCIPTTYAGSEMTAILGESKDGVKKTIVDDKVRLDTVIYDVDLTMTLPAQLSAVSGVNAIAHAVEALYSKNRNPVISLMAKEGIKSLAEALPEIMEDPNAKNARSKALYGAWLCSICGGGVSMAIHHKLCHALGGSFKLPHAETHTIILPHAISYNAPTIPDAMATLAEVLPESKGDAMHGLNVLLTKLKVKRALKDYGMKEEDIAEGTEIAMSNAYWNPRPIEKEPLQEIIRRCWAGESARADV